MAEKKIKPELPQPRTDVIFPHGEESNSQPPLRPAPPGRQVYLDNSAKPPSDGSAQMR